LRQRESDRLSADEQGREAAGQQLEAGASQVASPPRQLQVDRPGEVDGDLSPLLTRSAISIQPKIAIGASSAWPSQT
jgi:hypothetical protein